MNLPYVSLLMMKNRRGTGTKYRAKVREKAAKYMPTHYTTEYGTGIPWSAETDSSLSEYIPGYNIVKPVINYVKYRKSVKGLYTWTWQKKHAVDYVVGQAGEALKVVMFRHAVNDTVMNVLREHLNGRSHKTAK